MRKIYLLILGVVILITFTSTAARAVLTFHGTRPAFDAANPGLPIETFEEGVVGAGEVFSFGDPLNSATNNGFFSPGDILAGLQLDTPDVNQGDDLALTGTGFEGLPSKSIFANFFTDVLDIRLSNNSTAAGMDLFSIFGPSILDISVLGIGDVLLGSTTVAASNLPAFFGVSSTDVITRIRLSSQGDQAEGVDNIAFGAAVAAIPEPSTLLLIGTGLFGLALRSKKNPT